MAASKVFLKFFRIFQIKMPLKPISKCNRQLSFFALLCVCRAGPISSTGNVRDLRSGQRLFAELKTMTPEAFLKETDMAALTVRFV